MDEAVDNILSENLQTPMKPTNEVADVNRLEGSYRRIMCLLQNDPTAIGCAPAKLAE